MYRKFYGLAEKPFDVTPNPRFLFLSAHHQEALASIIYGIRERRGFIVLIGEVGTGKTTLLNATLESLDEKTEVAFIFNTDVPFEELLHMILVEFDLAVADEPVPKHVALDRLNRFATDKFAAGGNVVLIIDEAQDLDTRAMENLRLLSNLETRKYKLIQIVLSGQPELDEILRKPELRQLAQRISLRRYISPLNESDTYHYIEQHLEKAGGRDIHLFDRGALKRIWEFSRGVPRKINLLCDNTLLIAYGIGKKKITRKIVDEGVADLSWNLYPDIPGQFSDPRAEIMESPPRLFRHRFAAIAAILLVSLLLGAGSFGFFQMGNNEIRRLASRATHYFMTYVGISPPDSPGSSVHGYQGNNPDNAGNPPGKVDPDSIRQLPELPDPSNIRIETPHPPANPVDRKAERKTSEIAVKRAPTGNAAPVAKPRPDENPASSSVTGMIIPGRRQSAAKTEIKASTRASIAYKTVVVVENDYLAGLIERIYGERSEETLRRVLRANPEIRNPDLIMPGQAIRMPVRINEAANSNE